MFRWCERGHLTWIENVPTPPDPPVIKTLFKYKHHCVNSILHIPKVIVLLIPLCYVTYNVTLLDNGIRIVKAGVKCCRGWNPLVKREQDVNDTVLIHCEHTKGSYLATMLTETCPDNNTCLLSAQLFLQRPAALTRADRAVAAT